MTSFSYKSDFLETLSSRGFIYQVSDSERLDTLMLEQPVTGYIGFDCTAPSLHVGSLLPIMMLYWMQQTGHRPIALMGGGTTRVGDPSGKDESRTILTDAVINQNLFNIRRIFSRFLNLESNAEHSDNSFQYKWPIPEARLKRTPRWDAKIVNNADWLNHLN